MESRQNFSN